MVTTKLVYSMASIKGLMYMYIVFAVPGPLPTPGISGLGFCNHGIYEHLGLQVPMIGCRVLCRYVRVRFSGNVSLVQMFIKPAIYVGPTTNNV